MGHLAPMSCRPVLLPLCLAAWLASPAVAQTDEDALKQDVAEKQAKEQAQKASEAAKARNQAAVDGFPRGGQPPLQPPVQPAGQPAAQGGQPAVQPAVQGGQPAQGNRAPGAANAGNANANPRGQNPRGGAPTPAAGTAPVSGGSTASTASSGSAQGSVPKIQESGDFYILNLDEEGESLDLLWLTKMCQVATGKNFNFDQKVVQPALLDAKVRMFGEKRIPKTEFYEFYQILMFIHGFTITKVGPDHLAVFLIQSSSPAQAAAGKAVLKDEAIYILPDELDKYADQVATQIMTVLHLPNTDVRTLGSSLRGIVGGQGSEQTIMPVANTQSVVLRGFAPQVVSIARILKLVDDLAGQDTGVTPQFDVIPLEFAAAEDLADILEQLLEARKREAQTQRQANPQGATGQISGGGGESKILTYPRTNSLLVMALPEDMAAIKELVARLDVEVVEPERTYHVYALDHVKAEDLADVLEDFIEGASRVTAGGSGGRGAAQPAAQGLSSRDNEVIVVADETTNSLLIAASRRRYEEVVELIQRLDRRQEQVLIETALIELSGRDNLDLGIELGGADLPGAGTGSFGLTSFGLSTFEDSDGDGVFDQRIPNSNAAGITAGLLDGDTFNLPMLLVALRERQDTNVLNIPSVLVTNNGSASVKTLDEQPTTQITATGVGGQTQENFNDYQEAGITMDISPSISASGYLRLQVSLKVSNFIGAFSGAIPPPRITREITTQVNVPNGDTMVVGGIIVDNRDRTRQMIPWLGEIPLLGALFRRDSDSEERTTLYFFVTPHILRDPNFADLAEISYKLKLQAAEKIEAERVRIIDPDFGKTEGAVDLGSFDVPLFRSPGSGETTPEMIGADPAKKLESEVPVQPKDPK